MRRELILVIGRDLSRTRELQEALAASGFASTVLEDPRSALRHVWEHHPPLVVLDLHAPGIDGAFVAKSLKSEPGSPKILVIADEPKQLELKRTLRREHRPDDMIDGEGGSAQVVERVLGMLRLREGSEVRTLIDRSFAGVLIALWRQSATGALELESEGIRTTIYLVNGEPIFAEHGAVKDTLGRMLVRTGLLTQDQLARAIERMQERRVQSEQVRLGESLINLEMLTPEQVHDAITEQVREKVLACFPWKNVRHRFEERSDFIQEVGIFKCAVLPLVFEGIRRSYDPPRLAAILGPRLERYPRLRDDVGSVTHRFGLRAGEQQFLRSITGNRSIASLQEGSNLDRLTAGQLLATLVITDQLELWPDPSTSDLKPREGSQDLPRASSGTHPADDAEYIVGEYLRMKGKSDADVLRVPTNATKDEIVAAFTRGEARFGPAATHDLPAPLARKASEIYALMRSSRDRMLQALQARRGRSA